MRFKNYYDLPPLVEDSQYQGWVDYVNRTPVLKDAIEIMTKLDKTDPKARSYVVGGAVRDIVLGQDFDDIDIATNVPMETTESLFDTHDIGKNKDFGIVVVRYKGEDYEIANFREDGKYLDGRRPEDVKIVADFKGDASRRDFTINAMGIDKDGNISDYFDGQKDIQDKVIKTVGDPERRFGEDYLRMLRAPRFASRLGFQIDKKTMKAIQSNSEKIKNIASERVMKELVKMAKQSGSKFAEAIMILKEAGLLEHILPEVFQMDDFEHSVEHHPEGNVLQHTLEALKSSDSNDPIVNLSILLHDVGKITTHEKDPETGVHHYFGHAHEAKELIERIADRLKIDNKTKEAMLFSAMNHMKMHDILKMSNKKIMDLVGNDNYPILKAVAQADAKARGDIYDDTEWQKMMDKIDDLSARYEGLDAINKVKKIVNGRRVMELRGITKPGPEIGKVINQTVDWILDSDIDLNDDKLIDDYIKSIEL